MSTKRLFKKMDLTEGPVYRQLLIFALPILLGTIVTELYNVADSIIVGQFVDSNALAAVSAATPLMSFINLFMIGLASGSNVIIAQHSGSKDREALQHAISTTGCLTLICGIFVTVVGIATADPLLVALGTPEDILKDAFLYLIIIFAGTTGNLIYQMGSGALRGMGDSSWPFYFLCFCSLLNVILDLLAVLVFSTGVWGVALSTSLSQLISGIGVIYRLNHGNYGVGIYLHNLRLNRRETGRIIQIGLPAAIQNVGNSISAILVQPAVNHFDVDFIAANSIVSKIENFCVIPIIAISTALCTFVGQNMGKYNIQRVNKGINFSITLSIGFGIVCCGAMILFRNMFPYLFTDSAAVAAYTSRGLFIMSFMCIFFGIDRCLVNAMRGAGKSVVPMITAQFGAFSRIPLAYLLAVYTNNYEGIFTALLIATLLRCIAIAAYYYLGGWKRAVVSFSKQHSH